MRLRLHKGCDAALQAVIADYSALRAAVIELAECETCHVDPSRIREHIRHVETLARHRSLDRKRAERLGSAP